MFGAAHSLMTLLNRPPVHGDKRRSIACKGIPLPNFQRYVTAHHHRGGVEHNAFVSRSRRVVNGEL